MKQNHSAYVDRIHLIYAIISGESSNNVAHGQRRHKNLSVTHESTIITGYTVHDKQLGKS